jgi:hypothetical protein
VDFLPPGWEMAHNSQNVPYYIDHNTKTTHWTLPIEITQSAEIDPHFFRQHHRAKETDVIEEGAEEDENSDIRSETTASSILSLFSTKPPSFNSVVTGAEHQTEKEAIESSIVKGMKGFGKSIRSLLGKKSIELTEQREVISDTKRKEKMIESERNVRFILEGTAAEDNGHGESSAPEQGDPIIINEGRPESTNVHEDEASPSFSPIEIASSICSSHDTNEQEGDREMRSESIVTFEVFPLFALHEISPKPSSSQNQFLESKILEEPAVIEDQRLIEHSPRAAVDVLVFVFGEGESQASESDENRVTSGLGSLSLSSQSENFLSSSLSPPMTPPPKALPLGWEECYTPKGKLFYVNHNDRTTHWTIPENI